MSDDRKDEGRRWRKQPRASCRLQAPCQMNSNPLHVSCKDSVLRPRAGAMAQANQFLRMFSCPARGSRTVVQYKLRSSHDYAKLDVRVFTCFQPRARLSTLGQLAWYVPTVSLTRQKKRKMSLQCFERCWLHR